MSFLSFLGSSGGSTAAGIGTSLMNNIFGAINVKKTNQANLRINQMNNEFNERMMQKQMDYNTMMWNKQNEYNSPSAQRQRLEAAGLNPYMMLNGGSAGNASSAGSTSAASAAPSAPQQAFMPNFQGIPDSIVMGKQLEKLDAETHQQLIDNQTRSLRNMQEIAQMRADASTKEAKAALDRTMNNYADSIYMNQIQESRERQSQMKAQTRNLIREGLLMDKNLAIFDERTRLELAQMSADVLLSTANMRYTKQQTIHEVQKTIETVARTRGIKISNDVARRTADSIVEKARYDAYYDASSPFGLVQRIGQRVDNYLK